jgi:transcriptional regulator with PAS, ATPase and Fis domain
MADSRVLFEESFEKIAESLKTDIFELLHTGIALMSAKGYFLYCNKAFLEMYNLPTDVLGKHITDYFITGERGVMSTIRTRKSVVCSSLTKTNAQGISFRYPIQNAKGHLCGVVVESIPTCIGKDQLLALLDTVRNLEQQSNYYEQKEVKKVGMLYTFQSIIGESPAVEIMRCLGRRFACSQEPVLISGESGTGKELVAQALHRASPRTDRPFVSVNCAALPHDLMESELFGYAGGAFTGAKAGGIKGKFEMADTGTIFLDEIGELPLLMQAKLLRVLESGEIQKIAHTGQQIHSDFRLIAATNKDLAELVRDGKFRRDLYHRLNVFELTIPPLRNRVEDIPLLTQHFIAQSVGLTRAREISVDNELYRMFMLYPWRGNIRELKNVLTYALYSLGDDGNVLTTRHLPDRFMRELQAVPPSSIDTGKTEQAVREDSSSQNLSEVNARAERKVLEEALANSKYNKTLTAQALGISRNTLYRKLREYGLLSDT